MRGIERREKCYVEVIADHDVDGRVEPLAVVWEDGRVFGIDRVVEQRYAASMKVGGHGLRYTVVMGGRERFIWHDDAGWYVERIVHDGVVSLEEAAGPSRERDSSDEVPVEDRCVSAFVPVGIDEAERIANALNVLAKRRNVPIEGA